MFTVRWQHVKPGTQIRPIFDRSLNLWEADLAHFEVVSNEEARAAFVVAPVYNQPNLKLSARPVSSEQEE